MCDVADTNDDVDQLESRVERLEGQLQAVLEHMGMTIQYTPEQYDLVKPEDMRLPITVDNMRGGK